MNEFEGLCEALRKCLWKIYEFKEIFSKWYEMKIVGN